MTEGTLCFLARHNEVAKVECQAEPTLSKPLPSSAPSELELILIEKTENSHHTIPCHHRLLRAFWDIFFKCSLE